MPSSQKIPSKQLIDLGLTNDNVFYQETPETLTQQAVERGQGTLNNTGALCIHTGKFTGRSPQDKFIVKDAITEKSVNWNNINTPIDEKYFYQLKSKLLDYLNKQDEVWVRDCAECADEK